MNIRPYPSKPHHRDMICHICWRMLRGQYGRQWKGTYDLHFGHHDSALSLWESANDHCAICFVLYGELTADPNVTTTDPDIRVSSSASLSIVNRDQQHPDVYRLDFKIQYNGGMKARTFILKEIGNEAPIFRTPVSKHTNSDEVYKLALRWMEQCKCVPSDKELWWPTRLIDLAGLKSRNYQLNTDFARGTGVRVRSEDPKVSLVETKDADMESAANKCYVTLSHRWGDKKTADKMKKLTKESLQEFKDGMKLNELPATFRDAIEFAARLEGVGYIWIDSLCIIQQDSDESNLQSDWLLESAMMNEVYSHSYLNISATWAEDSTLGLYSEREPEQLWEEEVNLNIDGLQPKIPESPEASEPTKTSEPIKYPSKTMIARSLWRSICSFLLRFFSKKPAELEYFKEQEPKASKESLTIRRCILVDVSLWDTLVGQAPVNTRGWVLQERLLAPRVLHFCEGQVAWECGEFNFAEGRPQAIPHFQLTNHKILIDDRINGLDPMEDGPRLRQNRLGGNNEPDPHLVPAIYPFELWTRIVEIYFKTDLTNPKDKLIALSGIAMSVALKMGSSEEEPDQPVRYVAGLWNKYLESQLLWKIDPVFHPQDRTFKHPSKRPEVYRAPSFSWASVDAESSTSNGLVYGEVTDRDILIEVDTRPDSVKVWYENETEKKLFPFGLVTGGYIKLWGCLREAKLFEGRDGRYYWQLRERDAVFPGLDKEKHEHLYLDCPTDDLYLDCPTDDDAHQKIFLSNSIYVLPAAKGQRTDHEESKYIICLILQKVPREQATFRRLGLTKLSPWGDKLAHSHIMTPLESDVNLPHIENTNGYREEKGQHLIQLI